MTNFVDIDIFFLSIIHLFLNAITILLNFENLQVQSKLTTTMCLTCSDVV